MKQYYVYMLASRSNSVLYTGVTNDLVRRVYEHKTSQIEGFTNKYNCKKLVWYESTTDILEAIKREKQIKHWKREYKENIIKEKNPDWKDLYDELI